jgi:hypothetical protein
MTAGRPKKKDLEPKVQEHINLDVLHANLFNKFVEEGNFASKTEAFNYLVELVGHEEVKSKIDEYNLEARAAKLQRDADIVKAQLAKFKLEKQKNEEMSKLLRQTRMYAATAFKMLYTSSKNGITMFPEAIQKLYGISFDIPKCNANWKSISGMDDDELVSFLNIRKVPGKAKKEEEILRVIKDE